MHDVMIIVNSIRDVLLGIAGGMIAYLFDYSKAKRSGDDEFKFLISSMLVNMCLGAFVAYTIGSTLPEDIHFRDAIVGLSGVTAYNILLVAESKFAKWVIEKITK
jgi:NAD/NADP transhydrogenase beta subunit